MVFCDRNMWYVWKNWLINQYVCCDWRSTYHLSHKCHNGMWKKDLYPSCGITCSEVGTLVWSALGNLLQQNDLCRRRPFLQKRGRLLWYMKITVTNNKSMQRDDKRFTEVRRRQLLVSQPFGTTVRKKKTQISETRFKNHFLQGRNLQTQEVHNKDIWAHFVVQHLISEKQILVFWITFGSKLTHFFYIWMALLANRTIV